MFWSADVLNLFRWVRSKVASLNSPIEYDRQDSLCVICETSSSFGRFVSNKRHERCIESDKRCCIDGLQVIEDTLVVTPCTLRKVGKRVMLAVLVNEHPEGTRLRGCWGVGQPSYTTAFREKVRRSEWGLV